MNKQNINLLKKGQTNALKNLEILLWGDKSGFPDERDISIANLLLSISQRIENILQEKTPLQTSETDREIELKAVKVELERCREKCKEPEWDLRSYELTHENVLKNRAYEENV